MNTTEAFFHLVERGFPDLITLEDFQNATNDTTVKSRLLTNAVNTFGNGLSLRMRSERGRVRVWALRNIDKYEDLKESELYMEYLKIHGRKPLWYRAQNMPDLMTSRDVCLFMEMWGEDMNPYTTGKIMRKERIGLQLVMWDGEKQHRVWALRDIERYRDLPTDKLYTEYLSKKSSGSTVEYCDILKTKNVEEIVKQYYNDFPDLVTGDQIVDTIERSGLGSLLSSLCVSAALYKIGATQFRMWDGKRQHRVWALRNVEKYEKMTGKELYKEWTDPSPTDTEIKDEAIVKALPRLPDIVTPADVRNATGVKLNQVDRLMRNHGTRVKPFEGRTKQFMWIIRNYDKYRGLVGQDLIKEYEKCKKMR